MNKTALRKAVCRMFGFVLALVLGSATLPAAAQNSDIVLSMPDATIQQVLKEIEQQSRYVFFYNDIDISHRLSVDIRNKSISETLNTIFKDTDIVWKIDGLQIVLSRRNTAAAPQRTPSEVSGVVRDTAGFPLIGAAVSVKNTAIGTSTDLDGTYTLRLPEGGGNDVVILVDYLGYDPIEQPLNGRTSLDFVMKESTVNIDDVVVTALGIKRSEKALSYNVQQVSSESVIGNKDANFINSLNGKVAGVNINASSAGVGGASKVVMRGAKSISQSSNALYVIDGVPMFTKAREGSTEFGSQGTTDPIADINPEDIESISVLTGAAAAALYGSDAANGAIVVTTKKGQAGRLAVAVASGVDVVTPFVLPRFQNRYGTGDTSSAVGSETLSWGQRLNSANATGYNPAKDYFKTGVISNQNVSLSAGSERNQTYFSAGAINSDGIVPNNVYNRYNFTFRNTTSFLHDKMTLDAGASYVIQQDRNMINQGTYNNPLVGAYLFPRSNSWEDIQMYERYDGVRRIYSQYWPVGDAGITMQNPYWINYRNLRENRKDRYMLNASLSYDILDWLNVAGRVRVDNSQNEYTEKFYATTNTQLTEYSERGLYGITKTSDRQIYGDVLVNINKQFNDDWNLQANIGASISDMKSDAIKVRGPIADGKISDEDPGLTNVFNVQNLSNSRNTQRLQEGWREQTQSVFASAEVGYKGTYYLTLTGRNDWPSQLAGPHSNTKSFFYPSVGASVVISEIFDRMPENLSYIKLRASYASVGVAFERFIANPMYSWNSSGLSWSTQTQYPMYDLKPERTESFEVGLTMRFLKHFNLDVTYYHSNTRNQTFSPQISIGSGYSDIYIQSGNVRNQGVEVALGYSNRWGLFSWDSNYTLSCNRNKIISLANNVYNPVSGEYFDISLLDMNGLGQAHFILKEGGTLGDLYSMIDLRRDSNGKIYVDQDGGMTTESIQDVNKYIKLGSVLPDANMAWRNDFRIENFNFGFLVSARIGGVVFSRTQAMLDYYGVSEASAAARDAGMMSVNGGDLVSPKAWYNAVAGGTSVPQYYTYSATNVRLQEVSVGYTIPRKVLKNVCEINISVVGRNLWMIYNKAPFDPESIATTGNYYQGIDYFMMPALRNIGFNLRLKF